MTQPWKGGKSKKAPYETTHVRIPTAIKQTVEALSLAWKTMFANGRETGELLNQTESLIAEIYYPSDKPLTGKTQSELALEVDALKAEVSILKESLAAKETEIKLLNHFKSYPDLTKLKTYKLHGKDVVKSSDLVQLLTEHFGEL